MTTFTQQAITPARDQIAASVTECTFHDDNDDASECCVPGEMFDPEAGLSSTNPSCPICREEHDEHHMAADCCLWQDFDMAARMLIAAHVQCGTDRATAITRVARKGA